MIQILAICVGANVDHSFSRFDADGRTEAARWEVAVPETPVGYARARVAVVYRRLTAQSSTVSVRLYLDPHGGRDCSGEGKALEIPTARMLRALEIAAPKLQDAVSVAWAVAERQREAA